MLKKLRMRFIIINMVLVCAVLIVTFVVLLVSSANKLENDSFRNLEAGFDRIFLEQNDNAIEGKEETNMNTLLSPVPDRKPFDNQSPFASFYVTIDEQGNVIDLYDLNNNISYDIAQEAVDIVVTQEKISGEINDAALRYMINQSEENNTIIGFIDISYEKAFIQQQILNYSLICIGSIIAFFFISLFLSRMAIKPIAKAWEQQQQFVADASHELKTPITVMLANTSILLSEKTIEEENRRKWISYIDHEAKRMKKLVEDLLFLARIDSKEKINVHSRVSLTDLMAESVLPYEAVIFEAGNKLTSEIESDVYVTGEIGQIKQLLFILLDNANKYAENNSCITTKLFKENNKAIITVNNLSEPINHEDIKHIFDRFYRIDKARGRANSSYGLGLAIAKEIVNAQNGKIFVISDKTNGTTFKIELPLMD